MPVLKLASPQLRTDHPVWVYPDMEVSDKNRNFIVPKVGGVTYQDYSERYVIVWAANPNYVKYRLYGSISPFRKDNLIQDNILTNQTEFFPPVFVEVVKYYFWVAGVDALGNETYLSDDAASLETTAVKNALANNPITTTEFMPDGDGLNCEHLKAYEYIQSLNRTELELNGELAYLFIRRQGGQKPWGMACICNDSLTRDSDPDFQGSERCTLCFGTGIFGGYYPPIPIKIRYSNAPDQLMRYTKRGLEASHAFNTYMLWEPTVNVDDLIIRAMDEIRYVVKAKKETSARGIVLHQEFDIDQLEDSDIRQEVSHESIQKALDYAKLPPAVVDRFKIFG